MNNSGFDVDVDDWGEYTDIDLPVVPRTDTLNHSFF